MDSDFWSCKHTWRRSATNTKWCLIGCAIGDFGTIAYFQFSAASASTLVIFLWATLNGIITSILLETYLLVSQKMQLSQAFKIAVGMSLISMVAMEIAMNLTDYLITGGAVFVWWVVPIALFFGFITPWPYNYWRLKKLGKACH
ncbi:MAG: DUF4396 domain-containing protein [Candidatus Thioglobus sp.]|jgi:hypothetical protein|uniref:DUF4396 domain-containing protein n=1 Tax=Candidatus Thioglobus sp. TaxID=2026721 RepID=UPI0001BD38CA|nr:DUF4396 domain-containing protein [Candidatus Thioglobus sp.]EEZ79761.1 MAG: hypothetical protein Sup05_0638 [uncultured Candidatus Thioglobus sp.]MBT3186742.1 DUF4396 domain-containing protein [Candidatus Thioglobus sp.]MBT3431617.1 DUF4396 domain-containing protein [Candidatus Thioglobus sp.]MBT4315521.1 DUF4396 domain-containing protein [Candidatus Thioglobus sp.]MBT4553847.1 DUF4396 domain-containing protein [Candidatus Thioglobus sp.]